jgi:hypothetical protein
MERPKVETYFRPARITRESLAEPVESRRKRLELAGAGRRGFGASVPRLAATT